MEIIKRIHPNCSEWDSEVEPDDYDPVYEQWLVDQAKKKATEQIKEWDK